MKNIFSNLGKSKILALMLLPFVVYGLYYVYTNTNSKGIKTYAVDPLIVTYDGGPPPNPMFTVTNMLPGDEVEKIFNVENDSPDAEGVTMEAVKTEELKAFSGILDLEITGIASSTLVFSGKLQAFFDLPPINLGSFPAESNKSFRVKVKFPFDAGNEYQEAKVVFNIFWQTGSPPIELPPECAHLAGIITSVIEGTEGDDRINGTRASELILAKGGVDKVRASGGDDCIVGGDASDRLLDGSDGNDVIIGGPGDDTIDGSDDQDILYGNEGNDTIDGSGDEDLIYAGIGNDDVDGGEAADVIYLGEGDDEAEGGSGNDNIYGEQGNDEIDGEAGNDFIHGGLGDDELKGGSGSDEIYGNEGNDTIRGNSGNDKLDGGSENDNLDGDSGTDTCINGETESSCEL